MPLYDFILPGSIILLKFLLRMSIDQETKGADILRALMVFPIDIAFLSLSYGSAVLYTIHMASIEKIPVKAVISIFAVAICSLIIVIILAKKAERALVVEKLKRAGILSLIGYFFSLSIIWASISVGELFL